MKEKLAVLGTLVALIVLVGAGCGGDKAKEDVAGVKSADSPAMEGGDISSVAPDGSAAEADSNGGSHSDDEPDGKGGSTY